MSATEKGMLLAVRRVCLHSDSRENDGEGQRIEMLAVSPS